MFRTRLISGIILVAAALASIILGGWVLYIVLLALSLIGAFEFYRATGLREEGKTFSAPELCGYIGIVAYYFTLVGFNGTRFAAAQSELRLAVLALALLLLFFVTVFAYPRIHVEKIFKAFFGIIYLGVLFSYIYLTRMLPGGAFVVWLIFLSSWGSDTGAYCVGMLVGRHKLAPKLSRKKSIEGAIGGVAIAVLLGFIYALATKGPAVPYMIICLSGALISMVGDLAASAVKRQYEIKDYGHLIPGHGGVLDRFDSVLFTAPVIYFLSLLLL